MTPGMCRGQSVSGFVTEFPGERRSRRRTEHPGSSLPAPRSCSRRLQLFLDPVPGLLAYDRFMLPIPDLSLVADLADVDRVAQQCVEPLRTVKVTDIYQGCCYPSVATLKEVNQDLP